MLDTLRANSRSVLTYVLFGIIILVFVVSFGPGSKGCGAGGASATWAAKVNGETVGLPALEQQYGQLVRYYQQQGLRDLDAPIQARLRQLAMDQVIQRELVEQEARRQGIVVTDDDVSSTIKSLPGFQTDGRFDLELYRRSVTGTYGSPQRFEELVRRDLYDQKVRTLVRSAAHVTEDEVKEAWRTDGDRVNLEIARFPLGLARTEVKATDAQVKEYQAANGPKIEAYYKDNPARFDRKREVHARHVLVKLAPDADAAAQAAAKKKIDEVEERLKKGDDFAKVAAEVSDDPGSKAKGGDLGFFGQGIMAKPFEEAAFRLKPSELSAPVKTAFGWHVIQVLEVREPEKLTLEKAQPEIASQLLEDDLARKRAGELAGEALKKLQAGKAFAEVLPDDKAGQGGEVKLGGQPVKPEETGFFSPASRPSVPRIGPAPDLFADALAADAGKVLPRVYETVSGLVVARVKERNRPEEAKWAAQKADVEDRLRYRREAELERAWMEGLKAKAKVFANEAVLASGPARAPADLDQ